MRLSETLSFFRFSFENVLRSEAEQGMKKRR